MSKHIFHYWVITRKSIVIIFIIIDVQFCVIEIRFFSVDQLSSSSLPNIPHTYTHTYTHPRVMHVVHIYNVILFINI